MGKTITIEDDAYELLRSLKLGPDDSFTKVIRRHVYKPLKQPAGSDYPPKVDVGVLRRFALKGAIGSGGDRGHHLS